MRITVTEDNATRVIITSYNDMPSGLQDGCAMATNATNKWEATSHGIRVHIDDHSCMWCDDYIEPDNPCLRFQMLSERDDAVEESRCCLKCIEDVLAAVTSHAPSDSQRIRENDRYKIVYRHTAPQQNNGFTQCLHCDTYISKRDTRYTLGYPPLNVHANCWSPLRTAIRNTVENNASTLLPDLL